MGTAVSGMLGDTSWLATISQNIANANTTGYKEIETEFSTLVDAASANADGLEGVEASTRSLNSMQGSITSTSTTTDLAVQGDGYFLVSDANGNIFLTRNGSFVPDASGNLVNSAGYYLMGYNLQNGQAAVGDSVADLQKVNVARSAEKATATTSGTLSLNLPSTAAVVAAADLPSTNSANSQYTDMTSVVAYDNLGGAVTLNVYATKTAANTWEVDVYNAADAAAGGGFPYSAGPLTTATLDFDPTTGGLTSVSQTVAGVTTTTASTFSLTIPNGQPMTLDLGQTTQLASSFTVNTATANGNAPSAMTGVSISANGTLSYQYANGTSSPAYEIPLATVPSEDNLALATGDAYQTSADSGPLRIGTAGTAGFGSVESSSLESSTVDLATELTQMIEAQSAYQANSKAFQTGADLLDVLDNLKS
jgi:flagellar hook protein FlgE